jgi:hypothetical protein
MTKKEHPFDSGGCISMQGWKKEEKRGKKRRKNDGK